MSNGENKGLSARERPENGKQGISQLTAGRLSVACGLGGGSLVNAGVMLPTPIRARRNLNGQRNGKRGIGIFVNLLRHQC
ncbi:hypothetical protein D5086_013520 [Populus alba]|uniref:Uncharacterized protein n=1 Tax=Populus alba TaxID=43335 RepID=A0ACC4C6R4_POPAL